jgi:copper chaperone NosL
MNTVVASARRLAGACVLLVMLGGCQGKNESAVPVPVEVDARTTCSLDGMLLNDYPGPKGQLFYADASAPEFFCDTIELLHVLRAPEQVRAIKAVYVQDMAQANWDAPSGHWIDARQALYVLGSKKRGSMGATLASFAQEADARRFIEQEGGQLLRFSEIKADMVDLSGGALHDSRM